MKGDTKGGTNSGADGSAGASPAVNPVERAVTLTRTVLIEAPLEKVFAYYADPENNPEIWPSLLAVGDLERSPEGYPQRWTWVYQMAGLRFRGSAEMTEYLPNRRTVARSRGGIESVNRIRYERVGGGTRVTDEMSYRVPIPVLGRVAERALLLMNERELETIHRNLKAKLEGYSA